MQNFIKTLISAVQAWTKKEIKKTEDRIVDSTADWNENDSSKDSYIKNRTHWEEVKQKYLIPETSVFISEDYGYESLSDSLPLLTVGQEYIVVLNGTTYKCIAREYGSTVIIGNGTIYGDDNEGNGEPFSCDSYDDGSIELNVATAGKYTISISIAQTEIHKLNPKYLDIPDNLATTDDIQEAMDLAQTAADTKMDKSNPVGTGSFSMGRKLNSYIGEKTFVFGTSLNAPNSNMHVIGNYNNTNIKYNLQSNSTSTIGYDKYKVVKYSMKCKINNDLSISLLQPILQAEQVKLPQGCYTFFNDNTSNTYVYFVENVVNGENSAAITRSLLVVAEDNTACGDYIHIAGNGTSDTARSNAHTLDWNGVGWFQGGLQVGGNAQDDGAKNVLLEGDAIPVPSTAQVGQLLSVKAIDENSKPTEWEAVNAIKTVNNIKPDEDGNVELDAGFSPTATVEQTDDGAVVSITDKDGTTTATLTNGQRGRSILHVTTNPYVWDDGEAPYRMPLKTIISQAGVNEVLVGDIVQCGCDQYKVFGINKLVTVAYLDNPVSIKGVAGTDGTDGKSAYEYAQEAGYTGTKTQFAKKLASDNGVSSWNALSDKPFYEMDTLFDGNTSGHEVVKFDDSLSFVKMNDHVFTEEECIGKVASVYIEANDTVAEMSVSANGIVDITDADWGISGFLVFPDELMTYEIPAVIIVKEPIFTDYISLSAGTYYAVVDSDSIGKGHTTYFSAFDDVETIKKLDEKYLPDSVAFKSDIPSIEGLASEEYVNDAIANLPTGGGGSSGDAVEMLIEDTLTEAVTTYERAFTNEEITKINSARGVRFTLNTFSSAYDLNGIKFGIYRPSWYSFCKYFANNISLSLASNAWQIVSASYLNLFRSTPPIYSSTLAHVITGNKAVVTAGAEVEAVGLLNDKDSLKLTTTTEAGFPIGTVIKVEVLL